jgi:hypothetical protein
MDGFNWEVGSKVVGLCGGEFEGKATCYFIEVAGYRVEVEAGHWDEDCAVGGWDAFKDGIRVDGSRGSCGGCVGFGTNDAERLVTEDCLEAGSAFLYREVGEEVLVEAGVYVVPPYIPLEVRWAEEAEREAKERQGY